MQQDSRQLADADPAPRDEASVENPELSIVVPAYCEEQRLGPSLASLGDWLESSGSSWELLVVDDGSTDATARVASEYAAGDPRVRVISYHPNRGKGYAVRRGMAAAHGRKVFFTDADLSTPPQEIAPAAALLDDFDVVVGTRARGESQLIERQAWYREGMGRLFNLLIRSLGLTRIPDTQCGFKGLRAEVLPDLLAEMKLDGFAFDVELLSIAERRGMRVAEHPVRWINHPDSRVRIARHSLAMFVDVLRLALRPRRGDRGQ